MPLKVTSGKTGKTYDMPWSLKTDPSDDEVDKFIASQELSTTPASTNGPQPVKAPDTYGSRKAAFEQKRNTAIGEPNIKPFNMNDISLASEPYPVRAGKELFNTFVSEPSSVGSIAVGMGMEGITSLAKPYLSKILPFLNKGASSAESSVIGPKPSPINPIDASIPHTVDPGLNAGLRTGVSSAQIPNDTYSNSVIPPSNEFTPVGSEPAVPSPVRSVVDPVANTINKQVQGEARTLTQQGQKRFVLPQDLRGSKPQFRVSDKIYHPQFENDVDKAAYVIAQKTPSKRDTDFLKFFMDSTGMSEDAARLYGQQVRSRIKANVIGQPEGDVKIPDMFSGFKKTNPLTKTEVTNAAIVKEGLGPQKVKPVVRRTSPDGGDLLNPNKDTLDEMLSRGYEPTGEVNPDNSIKLVKGVGPVQGGPSSVKPLSAPVDVPPTSFPGGGNSGGIPPSNIPPSGGGPIPPVNPIVPTSKPQKFGLITQIGANIKSATAGLDLSFLGRQGRAVMHKKEYWNAIPKMYEALKSEKGYNDLMGEITNHPNYPIFKDKISFTNLGDDLTKREEDFMGNLVEKIPGIGRLYRASNRANSGFINKVRFDLANSLLEDSMNGGNLFNTSKKGNLVEPAQIADLVNVMTGRGKLGEFEGAAPLLNATMFAPRFLSSRAKLLTAPLSYAKADPFVRKEAIKSLAALVSSQATLIGFASALGMKHSFNPLNSDFAKFRIGNSRLDLNGGLQQLVVLASRLAPESIGGNRVQSSTTGRTMKLDTGKFGAPTTQETIGRFGESKEAPLLSLAMDLKTGRNFHGDKISPTESIIRHITPMVAQDLYDVADANPKYAWLKSPETLMIIPSILGGSMQTYGKKKKN